MRNSIKKEIKSGHPYPDEEASIKEFKKNPKTISWDEIKHKFLPKENER
jgi:hypothetical protein